MSKERNRAIAILRIRIELWRALRRRKAARAIKSQSATQGVSTGWKRRGEMCRTVLANYLTQRG